MGEQGSFRASRRCGMQSADLCMQAYIVENRDKDKKDVYMMLV